MPSPSSELGKDGPTVAEAGSPAWVTVHPRRSGTRLVLAVVGEADLSTATPLRQQLLAALAFAPSSVLLDLSGLTFCDLSGLDALNDLAAAAERHVPVKLRGMSTQLAWLHRTFPRSTAVTVTKRAPAVRREIGPAAGLPVAVAGQVTAPGDMTAVGPAGEAGGT
jgi:anti-anti-sigma regulatory factor